jgi:hypothetical protein
MSTLDEQLPAIHMEGHDEEAETWTEPFADTT